MSNHYWIGLDGTDSPWGGCTTWTMTNIIHDLIKLDPGVTFLDYPKLIRLNPNVPEKTRGNGALAINIMTSLDVEVIEVTIKTRIIQDQKEYQIQKGKTAAYVISRDQAPTHIYFRALQYICSPEWVLSEFTPTAFWPNDSQSLVGAIAAIAAPLEDHTFELIAYRHLDNCGTPRIVDTSQVKNIDTTLLSTFSNYDPDQQRSLITPSGPDPVFCGIRGEVPTDLLKFYNSLKIKEPISSCVIFRTNQATGDYISKPQDTFSINAVFSGRITLISKPKTMKGGHVHAKGYYLDQIFDMLWFEPTKILHQQARLLSEGDKIYVIAACSGQKGRKALHVEYMMIIESDDKLKRDKPTCKCGKLMSSAGSFKGYKCKVCGIISSFPEYKLQQSVLFAGQRCYPVLSAQRHLLRPLSRIHRQSEIKVTELDISEFLVEG